MNDRCVDFCTSKESDLMLDCKCSTSEADPELRTGDRVELVYESNGSVTIWRDQLEEYRGHNGEIGDMHDREYMYVVLTREQFAALIDRAAQIVL